MVEPQTTIPLTRMNVLVAIGHTDGSRDCIEFIARNEWLHHAQFRVITAVHSGLLDVNLISQATGREHARKFSEELNQCVPGSIAGFDCHDGHAVDVIVRLATQMNSNLVIVGSHPRSELKRFFMGSASQRILEQAPCSVLTVRKSEVEREPSPARIMVALDGSAHSELTVTWLGARNWANGTEFQFVSILPPLSNEVASGSVADAMSELASHGDLESQIMSEIDNLIYSFAPNLRNYEYAISPEAANGAAANQLVELAEEWRADLLVLGSHGHSGLGKVLIGSISLAVASHAGCSVLIVKERAVEHEPTENKRSDTNLESPHSVPYMF